MKRIKTYILFACVGLSATSCVTKKKFADISNQLTRTQASLNECNQEVARKDDRIASYQRDLESLTKSSKKDLEAKDQQIRLLNDQIADLKATRDAQIQQVGNLTVLTKEANNNIKQTLSQLQQKDQYIQLLQAAKTKADSINLALAVNLKGVLASGISDQDVDIKVDKTVVFINISDKMLFQPGSYKINNNASVVLEKIAKVVASRPELEVMVEGYTDNTPINTNCIDDNWDLSVKRATSVVRTLQEKFGVEPNRLIAAGRGEFNSLMANDTAEGKAANRRTRIILLPKMNQFYDLLDPSKAAVKMN